MREFRKNALVVIGLLLLSGCGQKGPLFMPEPAQTNVPDANQPEKTADNKNQ